MLESIGQVAVNVKDTARARAFYRDVLGLRHLFDAGPDLAFFQCGGVRLMLSPPSERQFDHPGSIIYDQVSDLAATHATLAARGANSLEVCALLVREGLQKTDDDLRYVGFRIPPKFVIGYGLDFAEKYRNLPYVCVFEGDPGT